MICGSSRSRTSATLSTSTAPFMRPASADDFRLFKTPSHSRLWPSPGLSHLRQGVTDICGRYVNGRVMFCDWEQRSIEAVLALCNKSHLSLVKTTRTQPQDNP